VKNAARIILTRGKKSLPGLTQIRDEIIEVSLKRSGEWTTKAVALKMIQRHHHVFGVASNVNHLKEIRLE
jgi:hypothetical protein